MVDHATGTVDGKMAAASTGRRHRTILSNAMDYAIERGLLETNPVRALKWTAPKVSGQVDRRGRGQPEPSAGAARCRTRPAAQRAPARRLLRSHALRRAPSRGSHHPQHRERDRAAPDHGAPNASCGRTRPRAGDWGELHLRTATPDAGSEWTDDGSVPGTAGSSSTGPKETPGSCPPTPN